MVSAANASAVRVLRTTASAWGLAFQPAPLPQSMWQWAV